MLAYAGSTHFSKRAHQSWRILAYAGMAVPLLSSLHLSASVVALTAAAFVLPSIWNLVESHRERNGDKLPAPTTYLGGFQERREFADVPSGSQTGKREAERSFEDVITDATYCSNEYGRRLSVICVRVLGLPTVMCEPVATLLRMNVRSKDEVRIVANGEFIVCSHLLRDALAADIILKRLEGALRKSDLFSASSEIQLGKAIYPMHGYSGADLISHARSQLQPIAIQT